MHKAQGNIQQNGGEKSVFQVNKQKYALYTWAPPPSSVFHKLVLSLELAEKIQYRLSEDVCCLVSLLVASFGHGCEPVGLTQTELSAMADTANGLSYRVSNNTQVSSSSSSSLGDKLLARLHVKMVQNFVMTMDLILSRQ